MTHRHGRGTFDAITFDPGEAERRKETAAAIAANIALLEEHTGRVIGGESMGGNAGLSTDQFEQSAVNFLFDAGTGRITYVGNSGAYQRPQELHETHGTAVFVNRGWRKVREPELVLEAPMFQLKELHIPESLQTDTRMVLGKSFDTYAKAENRRVEARVFDLIESIHGQKEET